MPAIFFLQSFKQLLVNISGSLKDLSPAFRTFIISSVVALPLTKCLSATRTCYTTDLLLSEEILQTKDTFNRTSLYSTSFLLVATNLLISFCCKSPITTSLVKT